MALKKEQAKKLIDFARRSIKLFFSDKSIESWEFEKWLQEKRGVFVTLQRYPSRELRGCIGFPYPTLPLGKAVIEAAKLAAFEDTRFPPLVENEIDKITIEISALTKPKQIETSEKKSKTDIISEIEVGKDGLIVEYSGYSGLLLPQVATEEKWDAEHFLEQTCIKAGISPQRWKNKECRIYKFQAQIFSEEKPNGKIIFK